MNYSVPYLQSNESYNPLFTKMKERFCADGTIAERMAIEAGICKKRSKKSFSHLSETASTRKERQFKKMFFSLKGIGAVSMSLLITGVLLLSGASFEGVQAGFMASTESAPSVETYIITETGTDAMYFAHESIAEQL